MSFPPDCRTARPSHTLAGSSFYVTADLCHCRGMHVIVVGCGRVGSELAVRLERDGHAVAIIDKNRRRLPPAARGLGRPDGASASASTATIWPRPEWARRAPWPP